MNPLAVPDQLPINPPCTFLNPQIAKPTSMIITTCTMSPPPSAASSTSCCASSSSTSSFINVDPTPNKLPLLHLNSLFPNFLAWLHNNNNSYPSDDCPTSATLFSDRESMDAPVSSEKGISDEPLKGVDITTCIQEDHIISPNESVDPIFPEVDRLVHSMIKPGANNKIGWILNFLQWKDGKDIDEHGRFAKNPSDIPEDDGLQVNKDPVTSSTTRLTDNNTIIAAATDESGINGTQNATKTSSDDDGEFEFDGIRSRISSERYKRLADHIYSNHNSETLCRVEYYDDVVHDRQSVASFLHQVPMSEAEEISKMCVLSNLAYIIPQMQREELLKEQGLSFVTSSMEKEAGDDNNRGETRSRPNKSAMSNNKKRMGISSSSRHGIEQEPWKEEGGNRGIGERGEGSDLRTGGRAGCPCEWFICDDETRNIRYIVVQGSDSLASWQTNLAFEPTKFEGLDNVWVHRGIYEAAKGLYKEVLGKLQMQEGWKLRFTGHSLGGSLGMLVALMAIRRGCLQESTLEDVVSFGAPYVLCGGEQILEELCISTPQFLNVVLHRDIVPRAFSCDYPHHVAHILKHVNGTFRHHPCLNIQRFLYAPLGEMLVLQPSDTNGEHQLLPRGKDARLYKIRHPSRTEKGLYDVAKHIEVLGVQRAFLNAPHPLEMMLKDLRAIAHEHDPRTYANAMKMVLGHRQLSSPTLAIQNHQSHMLQNSQPHEPQTLPIFISNTVPHSLLILLNNYLAHKPILQRYSHLIVSQQTQIGMILILSMTIHILSSLFAWA